MWLCKENDGFQSTDEAVDVGLLALVFEIFHAPHAFHHKLRSHAAGQFDGEVAVGHHLHSWVVGVEVGDGFDAFLGGLAVMFVLVDAHADDEVVGDGQRPSDDVVVTDGKVELPGSVGAQYATGDQWRNNSRKNEGMEPKQKQCPAVDVTGDRSKVRC